MEELLRDANKGLKIISAEDFEKATSKVLDPSFLEQKLKSGSDDEHKKVESNPMAIIKFAILGLLLTHWLKDELFGEQKEG